MHRSSKKELTPKYYISTKMFCLKIFLVVILFDLIHTSKGVEKLCFKRSDYFCSIGIAKEFKECLAPGIIFIKGNSQEEASLYCSAGFSFDFEITGPYPQALMSDNLQSKQIVRPGRNRIYSVTITLTNPAPHRFTFFDLDTKSRNATIFIIPAGETVFPDKEDIAYVKSDREILALPCIASDSDINSTSLQLKEIIGQPKTKTFSSLARKGIKRQEVVIVEDEYFRDGKYLQYDKTKGFLLNTTYFANHQGSLSCIFSHEDPMKAEERYTIKILPPSDNVIEPEEKEIIVFQNGKIHLSCHSKRDVILLGNFTGKPVNITSKVHFGTRLKFQAEVHFEEVNIGDSGNISCFYKSDLTKPIHTWVLSVLDMWNNNLLKMTVRSKKVFCNSTLGNLKFTYISCYSESNCRHRLPCFSPGKSCPASESVKHGHKDESTDVCGLNCVDLSQQEQFPQGVVGCTAGNLSLWTYYVKSVDDGALYFNWRTAPASALMEIELPKQTLYAGGNFFFRCRYSSFISNGVVQWYFTKKNDTSLHPYEIQAINTKTFSSSVKSTIKLELNMKSIVCSVPQWDGKAIWNVSKVIDVEIPKSPTIRNVGYKGKRIFFLNQTSSLWCSADGLPLPKIQWLKQGTDLPNELEQIPSNDGDNRVELKFRNIKLEFAGVYICNASNIAGFAVQNFTVEVRVGEVPYFAQSTIYHKFFIGDSKQLECEVDSYLESKINWTFPEFLNNLAFPEKSADGLKTISSIRLTNISQSMERIYNCTATNEFGTASQLHIIEIQERPSPVKAVVAGAGAFIVVLTIPLIFVTWRLRIAKRKIRDLTGDEIKEFFKGNPEVLKEHVNAYIEDPKENQQTCLFSAMPYKQEIEISKDALNIDRNTILGEGEFGLVFRADMKGQNDFVAVKTVKPNSEISYFKALLSELKIMIHVGKHPNIINLVGAHTANIKKRELCIIVELCRHGSLEKYLRGISRNLFKEEPTYDNVRFSYIGCYENIEMLLPQADASSLSTSDLVRWSYQIANGMDFLASKKVVHADLSTRNVLLHGDGTIRITDFGLSRQLYDYTQYVKKNQAPLPWRWMSIEALRHMHFSSQSDVWAFGVTLWEIFSLADIPYPGKSWTIDFVDELSYGLRMKKPKYATSQMYDIMYDCWMEDPKDRPSFKTLKELIFKAAFGDTLPPHPAEALKCTSDYADNLFYFYAEG